MELEETGPPPEPEQPPSDMEFEGDGDYEEGFYADWWQEPDAKGDDAEAGEWESVRGGNRQVLEVGAGPSARGIQPAGSPALVLGL